jgi:hypothetical protein
MHESHLLLRVLREPGTSTSLTLEEWQLCLRLARRARLLARLRCQFQELDLLGSFPMEVLEQLESAQAIADQQERMVRWEVNRLERVLAPLDVPVVLLKGSAYLLRGLPPARGREYGDVDIMTAKPQLGVVESAMRAAGWEAMKLDEYDQRYYRQWMHELPPLRHRERETVVDVHHAILPETGRLRPDSRFLLESAIGLEGTIFKILAPADMVLHNAAHIFQDGELSGSLRDLIDLDDLLRYFGRQEDFWDGLVPRSQRLELSRPIFYALRYSRKLLRTPIPEQVQRQAETAGPPPTPVLHLMDWLVHRALVLDSPDETLLSADLSRRLLYVRSHWLRMPPLLLARHLLRKSLPRRDPRPLP